ncbi:MAG TPA: hypothetical protein VMJ34_08750 [Bryobacteraceae bacterium]|nr:hypothetical protein [Bryobacteraceae bacterium]
MSRLHFLLMPAVLLLFVGAQPPRHHQGPPVEGRDTGQPNQQVKEALAKESYEESLNDTKKLIAMAEELKAEIEKNDRYVVSMSAIHKTEEIEKLAKRIRGRLKQ